MMANYEAAAVLVENINARVEAEKLIMDRLPPFPIWTTTNQVRTWVSPMTAEYAIDKLKKQGLVETRLKAMREIRRSK